MQWSGTVRGCIFLAGERLNLSVYWNAVMRLPCLCGFFKEHIHRVATLYLHTSIYIYIQNLSQLTSSEPCRFLKVEATESSCRGVPYHRVASRTYCIFNTCLKCCMWNFPGTWPHGMNAVCNCLESVIQSLCNEKQPVRQSTALWMDTSDRSSWTREETLIISDGMDDKTCTSIPLWDVPIPVSWNLDNTRCSHPCVMKHVDL